MGIELEATSGACIGVLGAGESGLGAAFLARAKGFEVFLSVRCIIFWINEESSALVRMRLVK